MSMVHDTRISKLRDKVLQFVLNNIIAGRFKLRTGTSIPAFAQAINLSHMLLYTNSDDIILDSYISEKIYSFQNDAFPTGSNSLLPIHIYKLIKAINVFIPYLKEFFKVYQLN